MEGSRGEAREVVVAAARERMGRELYKKIEQNNGGWEKREEDKTWQRVTGRWCGIGQLPVDRFSLSQRGNRCPMQLISPRCALLPQALLTGFSYQLRRPFCTQVESKSETTGNEFNLHGYLVSREELLSVFLCHVLYSLSFQIKLISLLSQIY